MSAVLVTGASGYLGGAVAAALLAAGHDVRTLQRRPSGRAPASSTCSAPSPTRTPAVPPLEGVDAVVHLAAKVTFTGDPADFVAVNVEGTRRLLADARAAGATRFVFVSSPSVAHTGSSIMGDGAAPAEPERARGDYARTKAAAELLALAADAPGFAVTAVRPHIVWGPGDPQLVARVAGAGPAAAGCRSSAPARPSSTPAYIDDAVAGIVAALDRIDGGARQRATSSPRASRGRSASCSRRSAPPRACRRRGGTCRRRWPSRPAPSSRGSGAIRPGEDEPPMTRFLAEQLSTAHWFDQRRTRRDLDWRPRWA